MLATCDLKSNFSTLISLDVLYNEMKIFENGLIKRRQIFIAVLSIITS